MPRVSQKAQEAYLTARDPILGALISRTTLRPLRRTRPQTRQGYFEVLVASIVGQQLSVKAADTIVGRIYTHFDHAPTPEHILATKVATLRTLGLSESKARYLHDLAAHVMDGRLDLVHIATLPDEEVLRELVAVKGIGPWTAEMFLMFSLRRPDVFSFGDLGLRNAMIRAYRLREPISMERIRRITARWMPYRSLAARYLWASLDNESEK